MSDSPDQVVRERAARVLATLMTAREIAAHDVGVLVERRRVDYAPWSEMEQSDSADLFSVSLGYPGSASTVQVDVYRGEHQPASLAWATQTIADTFQDEVVELLREARPRCPGHPHPMAITTSRAATSWRCPADPATGISVWP